MDYAVYSKKVEVRRRPAVCVVGGGPAGIAAAVSAARRGADVYLAEAQGCFGGAATNALVPAFMPFDNGVDFLAGGIGREVFDKCLEAGNVFEYGTLSILPETLKKIYDAMAADAGFAFSFFTQLIDVEASGGFVRRAYFASKSGLFAVDADIFIDATGDGDLCAWAGAPFEMGDERGVAMPATLCSTWHGIDWGGVGREPQNRMMDRAFADGVFTQEDRHLPGMWRLADSLGGGNIGHCFNVDATSEASLTEAMLTGRRIIGEYERYYRQYLGGGFKGASCIATGSCLGVRESRRVTGDYVMTGGDYAARASFPDEIGRFSYPIDIHAMAPGDEAYGEYHSKITSMAYGRGESYGIPMRALLPKGLENAYVAGRCISADRLMQSSVRVMPACFITGQACGVSASLASAGGALPRQVETARLRQALRDMGGFLPDAPNAPDA